MGIPQRGSTDDHSFLRSVTKLSLPDSGLGSIRELGALFDQSPIAMVFNDREVRTRRTNAAFRRLVGLSDEALLGRRPSEADHGELGMDVALGERTLAEQVISRGVPVINMHVEQTLAGKHRVFSWSAYRVTDNGHVLGALGLLIDITDRVRAVTALRRVNARLGLLERAGSQIGTTLDIHRTASRRCTLTSAGHLPPALRHPGGRVSSSTCRAG